ncbi:hypothetical protein PsorP6_012053 [Peronosclerospora sorghi]|uniref:Uncharacterized protein n=1 Tax=Peronosclerospora sorghi TaxID=230839 RepID=A0ACC0WK77_9STRA|nr:hypothetical protein PsorP6_012053 [Peronosclerospora sorghi]
MLSKVQPQVKHNADEDLMKQLEDLNDALVRVTAERDAYLRSVLAYDELKQTNKLHAGDVASVGEEADPARVETEAEAARVEVEAVATRVKKEADSACGEAGAYIAGVESESADVASVESAD